MVMRIYSRAQSAMEYLMTYGWAILIILIVLGVLYLLNVFSPNGLLGNQCNVQFKYSCTGLTIATNGTASLLLGQNTGTNFYNVEIACTESINSTGGPYASGDPWVTLTSELDSGTSLQVNGTPCYSNTGSPLGTQAIGTAFDGYLWMRYTSAPTPEGGANGWVTQRVATVYAAVGRISAAGSASSTSSASTTSTTSVTTSSTTSTTVTPIFATGIVAGSSPLSAKLKGSFTNFVCGGSSWGKGNAIAVNWSIDIEDAVANLTAIGRGANFCSISSSSYYSIITIVGLAGAPTPTIFKSPLQAVNKSEGILNYTVSDSNSFVVIDIACADSPGCTAPSIPKGCTLSQSAIDAAGDAGFIVTCQSQSAATYSVTVPITYNSCRSGGGPLGACNVVSMAAYVYPNYVPSGS